MKIIVRIALCIGGFLALAGGVQGADNPPEAPANQPTTQASASEETAFKVNDPYTAQRRPRVTVLAFDNTNSDAQGTQYGSSVEAMLVTFLKRKSQFVVVERAKLDHLLTEKRRLQGGMVQIKPGDKKSQALLEKVDVFVLGSVTLLSAVVQPQDPNLSVDRSADSPENTDEEESEEELERKIAKVTGEITDKEEEESANERRKKLADIGGARIEIDVKLISRFDGRIIAAAQRSGPVACLRSIVERLGVALEQEFLRPYYGELKVALNNPNHIRAFLTPILPQDALDEEKPPVERSTTVTIGSDYDIVESWTTNPTTYTIKNILTGWYSMRIERPGYSEIGTKNSRWEVRKRLGGQEVVYDRASDLALDKVAFADRRFIVRVDPLNTELLDGNALQFTFEKEGGSLKSLVKRQYMDDDYKQVPRRVVLMGGRKIRLNELEPPHEYADDERCDLFDEREPLLSNYGRTYVAASQTFNFDLFTGGELIIEDYQGEIVPTGVYRMAVWEPSHKTEMSAVTVHHLDDQKAVTTSLTRDTADLTLSATGPRPTNQVFLEGLETHRVLDFSLDFEQPISRPEVPADIYVTSTNISDLDGWQRQAVVPSANVTPPTYNTKSKKNKPKLIEVPLLRREPMMPINVKTRLGIAGRLEALSRRPDPISSDLFIDDQCTKILNLLLYGVIHRPEEERSDFWKAAAEAGRVAVATTALTVAQDDPAPPLGKAAAIQTFLLMNDLNNSQNSATLEAPIQGPDVLSRDPDVLRKLLASRLEVLDLVVLDPVDMVQLRYKPEVAAILARYVASGGSIFAYISSVGDYRPVIGVPLTIENLSRKTRRLDLAPGEVEGLIPRFNRKEVKVKARRALPEVPDLPDSWRTLAYTREGRRPRIIERGGGADGAGYVALWLDDPQSFRGRWGGTRSKVEETRAGIEAHILQRARAVMRQRFDRNDQALQPCAAPTTP